MPIKLEEAIRQINDSRNISLHEICTILNSVESPLNLQIIISVMNAIDKFRLLPQSKVFDFKDLEFQATLNEFCGILERDFEDLDEESDEEPDIDHLLSILDDRESIMIARKMFDEEIVNLKNIPKLFQWIGPGIFERPFLAVLTYMPKHLQHCLKKVEVNARLELAKNCFLYLEYYPQTTPTSIISRHLRHICNILECFTPEDRANMLDDGLSLEFFISHGYYFDYDDEDFFADVQQFKILLDECGQFYKPGLITFLSSIPKHLLHAILLITADLDQHLSILQSLIADFKYDLLQTEHLVLSLHKPLNLRQFNMLANILKQISKIDMQAYRKILNAILADPVAFSQVSTHDLLDIYPNGYIKSRFARLALIGFDDNVVSYRYHGSANKHLNDAPMLAIMGSFEHLTSGWKYVKSLHRTLLFVDPNNPSRMRAIKIKKADEHCNALTKEMHVLQYLHKKKQQYSLQSTMPIPVGVFLINDFDPNLKPEIIPVSENAEYCCYVYDAAPEQFIYLVDHDLSDAQFNNALIVAVHDLITLFVKDNLIMHQLIDLFHNSDTARSDGGIYNPIIELMNIILGDTQGKLMAWMAGCQYPNLRAAGLADFGDSKIVTGNRQLFLYLACYLLSFELIICYRARQLYDAALTPEQKQEIWQQAVRTIIGIYNCILAKLCLNNLDVATENFVDAQRLANQLQYWLTTEYVQDFEQGKFKRWIHDDASVVTCVGSNTSPTEEGIPTWNSLVGFTSFSNPTRLQQDIGPYNGSFPITELTKMRVATIFFISNNLGRPQQYEAIYRHDFALAVASSRLKLTQ